MDGGNKLSLRSGDEWATPLLHWSGGLLILEETEFRKRGEHESWPIRWWGWMRSRIVTSMKSWLDSRFDSSFHVRWVGDYLGYGRQSYELIRSQEYVNWEKGRNWHAKVWKSCHPTFTNWIFFQEKLLFYCIEVFFTIWMLAKRNRTCGCMKQLFEISSPSIISSVTHIGGKTRGPVEHVIENCCMYYLPSHW